MKRILIVDDAATVRLFHRQILEAAAYAWDEAVEIGTLKLWRRPSRVPSTCTWSMSNMPKLDGYGFLRELRSRDIPQVPAIMVSTEAAADDQKLAYASGANAYLIKPSKPEKLLLHVRLLIGGADTRVPARAVSVGGQGLPPGHRRKADATGECAR